MWINVQILFSIRQCYARYENSIHPFKDPLTELEAAEKLTFFSKYSFSNENKALSIGF